MRIIGIIMLIAGLWLNYRINRSRFNRRNAAGVEVFSSYDSAWSTRMGERFGKLIAILLILAGLVLLVASLPA